MSSHMHSRRFKILVGTIFVGVMLISACSAQQAPVMTPELESTEEGIVELAPTEMPAESSPTAEAEEDKVVISATDVPEVDQGLEAEGYPAPGYQFPTEGPPSAGYPYPEPEQKVPPPVKTELEATNPAMVNLSTGEPQLIEFFAFW